MVISKNYCISLVLKNKELQTIIAILTEDKVIELFCMADDFCKFFDTMMTKLNFSLGLALIFRLILAIFPSVTAQMSVSSIYCLTSLFPFSMALFCHAQYESAKTPAREVSRLSIHVRQIYCRCPW